MIVTLIPKTKLGQNIINENGDQFLILELKRHVTYSNKKEWFVLESLITKLNVNVHSSDDDNFKISKPL